MKHKVMLLTALCCGASLREQAQAQAVPGDPPALVALRQRYQKYLQEAESGPRTRWLAGLEAMERRKAGEGDFAAAAALKERRLSLANAASAAPATARPNIELKAAKARDSSGIDYADNQKEVGRFRRTGAFLEWELPGQPAGIYQVNLVCGVLGAENGNTDDPPTEKDLLPGPGEGYVNSITAGGVVEFRILTSLKDGGPVLRRTLRSTGGWTKTRVLSLGQLELDGKSVKFSLRAAGALPAGLMDFHRVELVASKASGSQTETTAAKPKELERLQDVYQKQFTEQTRTLNARFLKSLADLEGQAGRNGNSALAALVRQERMKLESGAAGSNAGPTPAPAGQKYLLPVNDKLNLMVRGEAKMTNQGDYLTRMRPAKTCAISWKLAGLGVPSGAYTVELDCRLTLDHGGSATLLTETPGGVPGPALGFSVHAVKAGDSVKPVKEWESRLLKPGRVIIPKGAMYLTLKVDSLVNPAASLFELKSLKLTPVPP